MKRDDQLWKVSLEDMLDDFLLFFFKEQTGIVNFDRGFEFLDKELSAYNYNFMRATVTFTHNIYKIIEQDADNWAKHRF